MQALNAWLVGHDHGLLLQGPDPDSPEPLLNGIVVNQHPPPLSRLRRWDPVTVWTTRPDDGSGVREPRRPPPTVHVRRAFVDESEEDDGPGRAPGQPG